MEKKDVFYNSALWNKQRGPYQYNKSTLKTVQLIWPIENLIRRSIPYLCMDFPMTGRCRNNTHTQRERERERGRKRESPHDLIVVPRFTTAKIKDQLIAISSKSRVLGRRETVVKRGVNVIFPMPQI